MTVGFYFPLYAFICSQIFTTNMYFFYTACQENDQTQNYQTLKNKAKDDRMNFNVIPDHCLTDPLEEMYRELGLCFTCYFLLLKVQTQ